MKRYFKSKLSEHQPAHRYLRPLLTEQAKGLDNEHMFRSIVDSAVTPIAVIDAKGVVLEANEAFDHLLGYDSEDLLGKNISMVTGDHASKHDGYISRFLESGEAKVIGIGREVLARHRDGRDIPVHLSLSHFQSNGQSYFTGILTDQTERIERELMFSSVFNSAVTPIAVIDSKGIVLKSNRAFLNLLGYSAEDLLGQNISMVTGDHASKHDEYISRYLESGEAKVIGIGREVLARHRDGRDIPVHLSLSLFESDGEVYFTGILTDQTERLQRERQLEKAKQASDEASKAKSQFLSVMSHELRTPLNGIMAPISLVVDEVAEEQKSMLELALSSVGQLTRIVDDILSFTDADMGGIMKTFELSFLWLELQTWVQNKWGGALEIQGKDVVETFTWSESVLKEALMILLDNAYKFTPSKQVSLSIEKQDRGQTCSLVIQVIDQGLGIQSKDLESIFDPFFQSDGSLTRQHEGTGMGLAVARKKVEHLGGSLKCIQSEVDRGSTFEIQLSMKNQEDGDIKQTPREGALLIVEDNRINAKVLAKMLEKLGHTSKLAENGQLGVEAAKKETFRAILMDLQMPVMDGFEATEKIRAFYGASCPPIVAVTANVDSESRRRCEELQLDGFLAKPVRLEGLKDMLSQVGVTSE